MAKTAVLLGSLSRCLLLCAAILGVSGGTEMASSAAEPLTLQFSISLPDAVTSTGFKLPDAPAEIRWSPDNRYLAVFGFSSGKLFLLDVEQRQMIDRNIHFKGGTPNIAWSADSSMLALSEVNIRLIRAADGKELGARDRFRYGRCATDSRQAGAFTPDGRFLWVSCGARGERGSYRAAEKLTVPGLAAADTVDTEAIEPDNQGFTHSARIVAEGGEILLSSILESCSEGTGPVLGPIRCRRYVTCLDLETKRNCFPSFMIQRSLGATYADDIKLLPGRPQIITFWAWAQEFPLGPDPVFKIYDFTGNLIRQFGIRDEFKTVPPRRFVVTRDGLVIGTAGYLDARGSASDGKGGRLMVWNANTGELLQSMSSSFAALVELSPDGRLVAVQIGLEIRVYSISTI